MLSVARWAAPYGRASLGTFVPYDQVRTRTGDILLIRLVPPEGEAVAGENGQFPVAVAALRHRYPGSPVVLWLPASRPQATIDVVRTATRMQVRGILGGPDPDPAVLREQLTDPAGLSAFVLRWASDAGYLPSGLDHVQVRELLDVPPEVRTFTRLARHHQVAARTWRNRLRQLGLPTPHAWLTLARGLRVAFFVQRHADCSLETLAERLHMHTAGRLGQQLRRTFGLAPSVVRTLLGAEPLLHRWFPARFAPGPAESRA
jgi:hypothetical protein